MSGWSSGVDTALSRQLQESESPTGYYSGVEQWKLDGFIGRRLQVRVLSPLLKCTIGLMAMTLVFQTGDVSSILT